MPHRDQALPGRAEVMPISGSHYVSGHTMLSPFPEGMISSLFALGCFWGAERRFWQVEGVYSTAVGYAGGYTENPLYEEVCSGMTGHTEVVLVVFDPKVVDYRRLLQLFWESHDPTQGMRQGNDVGTQYRSAIYCFDEEQRREALETAKQFQALLSARGLGEITTEIEMAPILYYAEEYHQQYLAKNPNGYCGLGGTGVVFK